MNANTVVLITFGKNPDLGLVLPVDKLPLVSALMADVSVVEPNNQFLEEPHWEPCDKLPNMRMIDAASFQAPSKELVEAREKAECNNNRWFAEYEAHKATKAALVEANAKVEALTAAGTCRMPEPQP